MTELQALQNYFWKTKKGFDGGAKELADALKGAPAAAIRKFLDAQGFGFAEVRVHAGELGSSVWAVGSHANETPGDKDATVQFDPNALSLAYLLGVVLHASRQPGDGDYGLPEGSRNPDGSINADVVLASIKKPK
ncbi:hypothetical protein [Rhizobium sp. BK176]|uniref:hypothetical protein n=1 Tax=Rhizobium sp. BK176 TaxID=2587071 RepID=UPI002167A8B3|nr:hypothetical protein [Rhizobium sp. BK176]MCS4088711.1 hypothetical protein [Rhizobium sp. BK176]